jgi:hypothetical protein
MEDALQRVRPRRGITHPKPGILWRGSRPPDLSPTPTVKAQLVNHGIINPLGVVEVPPSIVMIITDARMRSGANCGIKTFQLIDLLPENHHL